jgi:hypothetical protein
MRISPLVTALALVACGTVQAEGQFIPLETPNAQAIKFSENGDYLAASVFGGGMRWSRSSGTEEVISGMYVVSGINNAGTIAGSIADGEPGNGGHEIPAVSAVGAPQPTTYPISPDMNNAEIYDIADDGSAVGLTWTDDWSQSRAYYYSAATQAVALLPVTDSGSASRGNSISADGSVIAGWNDDPETGFRRGVIWKDLVPFYPTVMVEGTEYAVGEASAVSGNGHWVVGSFYPTLVGQSAWRYNVDTGELTEIPGIPFAFGVSDDGKTVVGASGFFDFPSRAAYVWTEAFGSQFLTDYMDARLIAYPSDWGFQGGLTAISGDGKMAAGWTITSPNGQQSFIVTGLDSQTDSIFANAFDGPAPVKDPGFEATGGEGGTNPYWDSGNTHPDAGVSVFYNFGGAHNGQYYAEFGGWFDGAAEAQYISQDVITRSTGPAYLNFWRAIAEQPDSGTMTITMDGDVLQAIDFSTAPGTDLDYVPQSIDVSSYADGQTHSLKFAFSYPGSGTDGAILIDDVSIDMTSLVEDGSAASAPRHFDSALLSIAAHRPKH